MKSKEASKFSSDDVLSIIGVLNTMSSTPRNFITGKADQFFARWATRVLAASGALLALLLLLAGVNSLWSFPSTIRIGAIGIGIATQVLACLGLTMHVLQTVALAITQSRRSTQIDQAQFLHDHANAKRLAFFQRAELHEAARWLGQVKGSIERRHSRFFGGQDKFTLLGLAGFSWTVWKETGAVLTSWQFSPVLIGVALLAGLVLGGIRSMWRLEVLTYRQEVVYSALSMAPELSVVREVPTSPIDPPGAAGAHQGTSLAALQVG